MPDLDAVTDVHRIVNDPGDPQPTPVRPTAPPVTLDTRPVVGVHDGRPWIHVALLVGRRRREVLGQWTPDQARAAALRLLTAAAAAEADATTVAWLRGEWALGLGEAAERLLTLRKYRAAEARTCEEAG